MNEKKILIVDDEPRTLNGLKRTLEKWSEGQHIIICCDNAHAAIDYLQKEPVHLLITDISMPEMTGLKLLDTLNKQSRLPMVIVISAYSEFEYAQEALRLGVANYLVKPVGKDKLIESVEEALDKQEDLMKTKVIEKMVDDHLIKVNRNDSCSRSIREAIEYIDEYYYADLSLKKVAAHVHLNPSYLSTLFKDELKLSFVEYLTRVRIQRAKQLLLTTDLNVTEIAEKVGYSTPKYFNKVFKEQEKVTPSGFRKK
ncbi:YesN/AraC family two-component response regulator [Natronobacillus azotifigens]|uniref:Response regulator n=1 Tax=Natronobacillus azotifigens TaxID=472978 RepID=A0A9J6REA9_9BACI|nr:response regulator [Natronobacillus azotifigens]MCZ0703718.1 response regulator [Natronobacillus azotifigens]